MNNFIYIEEYNPARNYQIDNIRISEYNPYVDYQNSMSFRLSLVLKKRDIRNKLRLFLIKRSMK